MRIWNVDPTKMCRQHLLGEHLEIHMFVSCINKGKNLAGYIDKGLLDVNLLATRHEALVQEMLTRGYTHSSPLASFYFAPSPAEGGWGYVDSAKNEQILHERCKECKFL